MWNNSEYNIFYPIFWVPYAAKTINKQINNSNLTFCVFTKKQNIMLTNSMHIGNHKKKERKNKEK